MIKSIAAWFILCTAATLCLLLMTATPVESASLSNRRIPSYFTKRDDEACVACTADLSNCQQRCEDSSIQKKRGGGDFRTVCQDGNCYCGFVLRDDAP